jgi:tol-pal system protein YbgF
MTALAQTAALARRAIVLATITALLCGGAASAQEGGFLDQLFGGNDRNAPDRGPAGSSGGRVAQSGDLIMRIDRLEGQIRQLTGAVEQLQYRNQQLEAALRRMQGEAEYRPPDGTSRPTMPAHPSASSHPVPPPVATYPQGSSPPAAAPGQRGDAFDPSLHPNAPGAPRPLGTTPPSAPLTQADPSAPVGAPGGRAAGAPLDLSTLTGVPGSETAAAPGMPAQGGEAPAPRGSSGTQLVTLPPSGSPRDTYDLGYGYILRRDYALAEQVFRVFLRKFPSDRLTSDAQYWLGESLFQRQRYRDAAEIFLNVSTKYETAAKAPNALLRLGQSLAALGEKEAACASFGEALRKYPRASVSVKQGVDREQKRVHC